MSMRESFKVEVVDGVKVKTKMQRHFPRNEKGRSDVKIRFRKDGSLADKTKADQTNLGSSFEHSLSVSRIRLPRYSR